MKTLAYLRVSKDNQDVLNQKITILEFARQEKITIDDFISIEISSQKSRAERRIDWLLEQLDKGDTLIVNELSRMGRSVGEVITTVETLLSREIRFFAIKEGIRFLGEEANLQTKVMITMFSLFAEIERSLCSQRTKEGLAAARSRGKKLGRPKGKLGRSKLDGKEEEIKKLMALGVSMASIAKMTGVCRGTVVHFIKTRKLQQIS